MNAQRAQRFGSIEAGRGIAALLVVLFHASAAIFPAPKYFGAHVFGGFFDFGEAGVEYFFVLSGFIIAHVHWRDIGQPTRLADYARRRFLRIYPIYWVVLCGLLLLLTLPLGLGEPVRDPGRILSSFALVGPDNLDTVVAVAWTLYHEILFYGVFALWIVSRRAGMLVTIAWGAAIAAGAAGFTGLPAYVMSPLNLLFGVGIIAWRASRAGGLPRPALWAVAGAAAFLALGIDRVYFHLLPYMAGNMAFGLAAGIGLAGLAALERKRPLAVPRPLLLLGAASYAIYLSHFPLLSLAAKIAVRTGMAVRLPAPVSFVLVVAAVVIAGIAFHLVIERPLNRALGRWRGRSTASTSAG